MECSEGSEDFKNHNVKYLKNYEVEYLSDVAREIYFWVTAGILILTFLISTGVIYIILTYSTPSLKVYRWYMLHSVILTYIHAVNVFIFQPFPIYPDFVFIVNGPVKNLPLRFLAFYQPFALGWAFLASGAVTLRFYYRYIKVCTHSWFYFALSSRRKAILIVTIFLLLISSLFTGDYRNMLFKILFSFTGPLT